MRTDSVVYAISIIILLNATSCRWDQISPEFDCSTSPIEITILENEGTDCGSSNGSFSIAVSGGEGPYHILSDAGTTSQESYSNLGAGDYLVSVSDVNGCASELTVTINNLNGVNIDAISTTDAGCGSSQGKIEITASGGQEPYLFAVDGGTAQESNSFISLENGSHLVTISDQLGCEVNRTVNVLSGVSYQSIIKDIIKNNCLSCHANFSDYNKVKEKAGQIKSRTQSRDMPRDGSLSQSQIDAIACWVEDGALNN